MRRILLALVLTGLCVRPGAAQSVVERTPNLSGGWTGPAGTLHFHFLHRFNQSGAPQRQVVNRPTFLLGWTPAAPVLLGVHYSTRSDLVPRYPNEWELFARGAPLRALPVELALQAGWNVASESVDGELAATRAFGPARLLVAGRAFSAAYAGDSARLAIAGGLVVRVRPWLAIAADAATLTSRAAGEKVAWGAGLQIAIPYTPHSLSLQATNTNGASLEAASRGGDEVRWGFEFTVPITPSRYFGARADTMRPTLEPVPPPPAGDEAARAIRAARGEVAADIAGLAFRPDRIEIVAGTTVTWTNRDQVVHTVTAADGSWTSPGIEPGGSWSRTFETAGTFAITCTPHPFMRAQVIVRERS